VHRSLLPVWTQRCHLRRHASGPECSKARQEPAPARHSVFVRGGGGSFRHPGDLLSSQADRATHRSVRTPSRLVVGCRCRASSRSGKRCVGNRAGVSGFESIAARKPRRRQLTEDGSAAGLALRAPTRRHPGAGDFR